jgi:hypothetical protein
MMGPTQDHGRSSGGRPRGTPKCDSNGSAGRRRIGGAPGHKQTGMIVADPIRGSRILRGVGRSGTARSVAFPEGGHDGGNDPPGPALYRLPVGSHTDCHRISSRSTAGAVGHAAGSAADTAMSAAEVTGHAAKSVVQGVGDAIKSAAKAVAHGAGKAAARAGEAVREVGEKIEEATE